MNTGASDYYFHSVVRAFRLYSARVDKKLTLKFEYAVFEFQGE